MIRMEIYNITYSCGCLHEIKEEHGLHKPTGHNKDCEQHKKPIEI